MLPVPSMVPEAPPPGICHQGWASVQAKEQKDLSVPSWSCPSIQLLLKSMFSCNLRGRKRSRRKHLLLCLWRGCSPRWWWVEYLVSQRNLKLMTSMSPCILGGSGELSWGVADVLYSPTKVNLFLGDSGVLSSCGVAPCWVPHTSRLIGLGAPTCVSSFRVSLIHFGTAPREVRQAQLFPSLSPQADNIFFLRSNRDREENQTISPSWDCCSGHYFSRDGDIPRRSMRCNGKNLRPKLLDNTSSWIWESRDLSSESDSAAYECGRAALLPPALSQLCPLSKGRDQLFLPSRASERAQRHGECDRLPMWGGHFNWVLLKLSKLSNFPSWHLDTGCFRSQIYFGVIASHVIIYLLFFCWESVIVISIALRQYFFILQRWILTIT